jgi:succinyldiaminopimelate transaminase
MPMTGDKRAPEGFVPPPYPYDRLDEIAAIAAAHDGGCIDLSVGTPVDPTLPAVLDALGGSGTERGYPASIGSLAYRQAAAGWLQRRFGATVAPGDVAACVGTKEFVALLPQFLHLRRPERDTILYPAISYPTYAMGATLGGCRAVPVPVDDRWRLDLSAIDRKDAARALALWVNSPGNPAGNLDDLGAAAAWGRANDVPVFSDECYIEFTWDGPGRTILEHGTDGVVAVHSLSKRSNLAGARAGFYAGDHDLVHYLSEVRKHAGLMVPGPVQAAAVAALADDDHVDAQRAIYRRRLERCVDLLAAMDAPCALPQGGFYLWAAAPGGDAWALVRRLATEAGVLVSPGEFYGPGGAGHVRLAVVQPDDHIERAFARLGLAAGHR